jgi:peptide/nickel transport system permease protein
MTIDRPAVRFVVRRVLFAVLLVFIASSAALVLTRIAPGGLLLDPSASPGQREEAARLERQLGLDRPLASHYLTWLSRAVRLDFGYSVLYSRPVGDLLGERAANTAILATAALLLATLAGIPLGIFTGTRPTSRVATLVRALSMLMLSVPPLIGSLVLLLLAARTGWFPVGGMTSAALDSPWGPWVADVLWHLPVPALALALPLAATLERLQAQAIATALNEPFVGASRARGVSAGTALARHAWPTSLAAVLGVYALIVGTLFSGSFVVEVVTSWPGLGRLMVDGLRARDIYLVTGSVATGAACLSVATLVTDLASGLLDPRVREGR